MPNAPYGEVKPDHQGCGVYPVGTFEQVIDYFRDAGQLENALQNGIKVENLVDRAVDFDTVMVQKDARDAACIAAAGGHNLQLIGLPGRREIPPVE